MVKEKDRFPHVLQRRDRKGILAVTKLEQPVCFERASVFGAEAPSQVHTTYTHTHTCRGSCMYLLEEFDVRWDLLQLQVFPRGPKNPAGAFRRCAQVTATLTTADISGRSLRLARIIRSHEVLQDLSAQQKNNSLVGYLVGYVIWRWTIDSQGGL